MIGDTKVNLGPFATLFGPRFGFFDDRKAWGRGSVFGFGPRRGFSGVFGGGGGLCPRQQQFRPWPGGPVEGWPDAYPFPTASAVLEPANGPTPTGSARQPPAGSSAQTARGCASAADPTTRLVSGSDSHVRASSAACRGTRPGPRVPDLGPPTETSSRGGRAGCQWPQSG